MKNILLFIFFLFTISINNSQAQNAIVRGFVYEKESGEAVLFVNVYLKGTKYVAQTDVNGYFSINKVPPGDYFLTVTAMGWDTLSVPVKLVMGETLNKKLFLVKRSVNLRTVEVSAEKTEQKSETKVGVQKITPRDIKRLPSIGGEPDLAQYLQVIPGVIFTGDQGGQLYIRGGTPVQNKVLLDGMIIYNPFHSIGLFSVFDTDILSNTDVYTGAFPSKYGGRISSVMDITTRDGNKKHLSGKISTNTFQSKLLVEGPLKRAKTEEDGSASFIFSIKDSYLDKTSKLFYNYVDKENGLPFKFRDIFAKVSTSNVSGSKISLFGFNFNDEVNYKQVSNFSWGSNGFGSKFVVVPGGSQTLIDGNFAYSKYSMQLKEADEKPRLSETNGFNMAFNFTYFSSNDEFKYGLEVLGFKTNFKFYNLLGNKFEQAENTTEFGAYLNYKKVWSKVVLNPGFRMHYYASLGEAVPEPRISVKYNMFDKFRLKAAAGTFSQNLLSATSDKDIVNFFYGFLSAPESLPEEFNGEEVKSNLQKARHIIAGFEWDLPLHLSLNVEGYVKRFNQLININRDKIYEDTQENADKPDELKRDYRIETGTSKGLDFVLKYDYKRFYIWAVYSLGFVDRFDGKITYQPNFDRRHNINVVTSLTFGKSLLWEADIRWNFGSGFPFTPTQGFYPYLNFGDGIFTDYTTVNGYLGVLYGDFNSRRLPYYHRLDFSIKRTFVVTKKSNIEASFSISNVYDRRNIFYFDRIRYKRVDQLPFLPAMGVNWTF
ncbi:MAG: TonB-dependent receptor [Bacteroidetes bacterium]|nr:TonB-dependent receptor [Bacteroidota bacterium]